MAQFLLVHGAWHGAWCWERLIPALEALGHGAGAIDLPGGSADHPLDPDVSLAACVERVAAATADMDGQVWLVGHSLGGTTVAQACEVVAERVAGAVYLAASMPVDGQSHLDALGSQAGSLAFDTMVIDPARGAHIPAEHRAACFYEGCAAADATAALARLAEWQPLGPAVTPVQLTPDRAGKVPRYYIECLRDRAVTLASQRRMQQAAALAGAATLDTCHSPFLAVPDALAALLAAFAASRA